jgi:hypothetical protein
MHDFLAQGFSIGYAGGIFYKKSTSLGIRSSLIGDVNQPAE